MRDQQHPDVVTVRIYYDFASTLCYVAHRVLSTVEPEIARVGVELEWRPLDLTMIVPWNRGDSFTPEVRASVHNTALSLGLDIEMPDPWLDSRPASKVALKTTTPESEQQWRHEVFDSIYEHRRFALTSELVQLARELTGVNLIDDSGESFERVEESTRDAVTLGVSGVPTFLVDEALVGGIYDGHSMVELLRQLAEKHREIGNSTVN